MESLDTLERQKARDKKGRPEKGRQETPLDIDKRKAKKFRQQPIISRRKKALASCFLLEGDEADRMVHMSYDQKRKGDRTTIQSSSYCPHAVLLSDRGL